MKIFHKKSHTGKKSKLSVATMHYNIGRYGHDTCTGIIHTSFHSLLDEDTPKKDTREKFVEKDNLQSAVLYDSILNAGIMGKLAYGGRKFMTIH